MKILVVDDDHLAAEIAAEALRIAGFEVSVAHNGEEAWTRISKRQAEIIITDWMMPGLDGPSLCRRIRELEPEPYLYVLLVTARDEVADVVEGLAAGADDFLRKPFSPMELVARISAIQRMKELHDRISDQNRRLKRDEELRRDWINMIVHDLRSPLAVIQGSAELLQLKAQPPQERALTRIGREAQRVHGMLEQMLVMAKSEAGRLQLLREEQDVRALTAEIAEGAAVAARDKSIRVALASDADAVPAAVDAPLWRRMVENLVGNAVKFTPQDSSSSCWESNSPIARLASISDVRRRTDSASSRFCSVSTRRMARFFCVRRDFSSARCTLIHTSSMSASGSTR